MIFRLATYKTRALLAAGFIIAGAVLATTVPAYAAEQGSLGGKPANPREGNPRSESIFVHELDPGQQAADGVQVINGTTKTKRVLVYAVDSQLSSGGAFACAQAADKPIAVGTWVALDKGEVTLEPGGKEVIDFTINVPKDTSPGEHNGCIVIQDTEQQRSGEGSGIVLSMRSAIRLVVTIPGDIQKGLAFTGLGAQAKDEKKILLSANLKNNGNVSLDAQLDIKLAYLFGSSVATAGGSFPVLSGSEARFNFEGSRPFFGGWYKLTATARYNDSPEVSIGEGNPNASTGKGQWIFIAPQPAAAAIEGGLAVLLASGGGWYIRRRLVHKKAMSRTSRHTVQAHENLHTIAERYDVSWKLLARINKLKPPYQLKPGQAIVVTLAKTNKKRIQTRQ
jgi:LysM domain-containing protein/WxL interacting protein linking bacterial and host surfaces